ncbi:MAG TPA: ribosomal protein L13e [Candidatus Limnocylindrales bacterium]|nr:ribosomal protein L13e [Candidatus Limnocylindrales bacterium]
MPDITAIIIKRNGKKSTSRGFSLAELKQAGLTRQDAKQMSIPLDVKRKSLHDENVEALKVHAEKAKAKAKPKEPKTEPKEELKKKPKKKAKS